MPTYKNELERFVYTKCYNHIFTPLSKWCREHPHSLKPRFPRVKYPDTAMLQSFLVQFTDKVTIEEDVISFDAILDCTVELREETDYNSQSDINNVWLRVSCSVEIKDIIKDFTVHAVEPYKRKDTPKSGKEADGNFVPIISKKNLDLEATRFLEKYCPEALVAPMAVPIEEIVKSKMNLDIITGKRLSDNFNFFGQICFSPGIVKVYDLFSDTEEEIQVKRGTIFIDLMTFWERNLGCVHNTIAHEAFHWHRHRIYAAIKSLLRDEMFISHRCPSASAQSYDAEEEKEWTDEDRMEWQANHVAPRILMPVQTVKLKIEELLEQYSYSKYPDNRTMILECVIDELSRFYKVSKQAAKIRMKELGYKEADSVYNFDGFGNSFNNISPRDAFYEYCDNEEFRSVIDSGLFRYVDGHFVIDNEKYVALNADGIYDLTEYAENNLNECVLKFTYRRVDMRIHGIFHKDTFHRPNTNAYGELPSYDTPQNASIIDNALELERQKAEFEKQYSGFRLTNLTFPEIAIKLMELKKWNSTIFKNKTHLGDTEYSKIKNKTEKNWTIQTVIAVCIGLEADQLTSEQMLKAAGHTFGTSQEHRAYAFVISRFRGIDECNTFLESVNAKLLGNQPRKGS